MDLKELKAHAYDLISNIETFQRELQKTNQEILKTLQETQNTPASPAVEPVIEAAHVEDARTEFR